MTYPNSDITRRAGTQIQSTGTTSGSNKKIERRLRYLETKMDMLMVLVSGSLVFDLLLLIAILLK